MNSKKIFRGISIMMIFIIFIGIFTLGCGNSQKGLLNLEQSTIEQVTEDSIDTRGTSAYTPLKFNENGSGNNFIYSNNPESLYGFNYGIRYLYGSSLQTSYKDVEFYHTIFKKSYFSFEAKIGVAIYNGNYRTIKVTCKKGTILALNADNDFIDQKKLTRTPTPLVDFMNSTKTEEIYIPSRSARILWVKDFVMIRNFNTFVFGRARFKTNTHKNVWIRVFACTKYKSSNKKSLITAKDVFSIPGAGEQALGSGQFCGELKYTEKNATINDLKKKYVLAEWPKNINSHEYSGVISYKKGAKNVNAGNFGVVYNIKVKNKNKKYMKIKPIQTNWRAEDANSSLVYKFNKNKWKSYMFFSTTYYEKLKLKKYSTNTFKFILPGGNCGNFEISFQ